MKKFKKSIKKIRKNHVFWLVLLASFLLKIINLNYNSPFGDEAVYAIVGKLGLFKGDWYTLFPFGWLGGVPYMYPVIAAVTHSIGGIVAERFLNVFLFVLTSYFFYKCTYLLRDGDVPQKRLSALISTSLFCGASVGYLVSRLATYDMPSFTLLMGGVYFFVLAEKSFRLPSRKYIVSAVLLSLSFYFKYVTALFLPVLLVLSLFLSKKTKYRKKAVIVYFLVPIVVAVGFFVLTNIKSLQTFLSTNVLSEKDSIIQVIWLFLSETALVFPFYALGFFGLIKSRKYKKLLAWTMGALLIIGVHVVTLRTRTLDKHLLLTVGGFCVVAGLGIGEFINSLSKKRQIIFKRFLITALFVFWVFSFAFAQKYNTDWVNTDDIVNYAKKTVDSGDIVLSEVGTVTMLELYPKVNPVRVYTFNWISYHGKEGEDALDSAVSDGYFNDIILEKQDDEKIPFNYEVNNLITENDNFYELYSSVFEDSHFIFYKRNY